MVGRFHRLHLHRHADDCGVRRHLAGHAGQDDLPALQMGGQRLVRDDARLKCDRRLQTGTQGHSVRPGPPSVQLCGRRLL